MSVPHETWRGGREEARKETLERRESDAFEVVLGSLRERRADAVQVFSEGGGETGVSARREAWCGCGCVVADDNTHEIPRSSL
jgi:hypothetical protein